MTMSSSLLNIQGKRFWMHNGVAEVFLQELLDVIKANKLTNSLMTQVTYEISAALDAGWIDGIIISDLNTYLNQADLKDELTRAMTAACFNLLADASNSRVTSRGNFCAGSDFLTAELKMLQRLLKEPESITEPPVIYRLGSGWGIA